MNLPTQPTNQAKPTLNRHLRRLILFMVATLVAVTAVLLPAPPPAEAQDEVRFDEPGFSVRCRDNETSYPSGITSLRTGVELMHCVEFGFTPITDESLCSDAFEATGRSGWWADLEICVAAQVLPVHCRPPFIRYQWTSPFSGTRDGCVIPMMSNFDYLNRSRQVPVAPIPVCIEHTMVQDAADVSSLAVGSIFQAADDATLYIVTTGGDCTFGCVDGFDVNCDGKLGDYCASELDRHKASDVAICMQAMATAEPA